MAYKGLALAHLDEGATASVALLRLLEEDDKREERQVGIVDVDGGAASHTGHACLDWAGSLTGDGYAIQGNILTGEDVVDRDGDRLGDLRPGGPAGASAARGAHRRRRGGRRLARPPVGGAAGGQGGRRLRRPRRRRRRPAGRRPRGADPRAGPAARPSASSTSTASTEEEKVAVTDELGRSWRRSRRRRAPATSRPGSAPRTTRCGWRPTCPGSTSRSSTSSRATDSTRDRPRHRRRHHRRHRRRRHRRRRDRGQGLPGVPPALPAARAGSSTRRRRSGRPPSRRPARRSRRSTRRSSQAVGITNQRETILLWDRETLGSPRRAIVWQDRRTADICTRLKDAGHEERVAELTGLRLDPYFSGTKLMWLAEHEPHTWALVESGRYAVGTVDSYLIARMTRGTYHVTDVSNACRTLLFDLNTGDWSDELCELFGVPRDALPELVPNWGEVATTDPTSFLDLSLPIAGHRRRPAVRAVRADLLRPGRRQVHLRHRLVHPHQHRHRRWSARTPACSRRRPGGRRTASSPTRSRARSS